jgi:hypothetical protein
MKGEAQHSAHRDAPALRPLSPKPPRAHSRLRQSMTDNAPIRIRIEPKALLGLTRLSSYRYPRYACGRCTMNGHRQVRTSGRVDD